MNLEKRELEETPPITVCRVLNLLQSLFQILAPQNDSVIDGILMQILVSMDQIVSRATKGVRHAVQQKSMVVTPVVMLTQLFLKVIRVNESELPDLLKQKNSNAGGNSDIGSKDEQIRSLTLKARNLNE